MFNFQKFLNDYNIPIPEGSKNTGQNWINIRCPFGCGDTTNHLGFNTKDNYFSCWKCSDEKGSGFHSIESVIEKLLPYEDSSIILKKYNSNIIYNKKLHKKLNKKSNIKIKLPGEDLKPVHRKYLIRRKYVPDYIIDKYKIKGSLHIGKYRYRLIIPIFYNKELVTFQTRALNNNGTRYINCDPEKEIIPIKHILYNIDNCKKNYCVLVEGVMKVWRLGDNSLACLGKNYTSQQLNLLVQRYKKVYVWLDNDKDKKINYGQKKAKKICQELNNLGIETFNIISDIAPDNISQKEADDFMESIKE